MLAAASFGMPDPADGSTSSQHMVKMLAQLGIADAMKPKIRHFKDGTQALQAVAKGEIALTVAPMTSIRVVPGVALAGPAAGRAAKHDRLCGGAVAQIGQRPSRRRR